MEDFSVVRAVLETLREYGELNVYCSGFGCNHVFQDDSLDPRVVILMQTESGQSILQTFCFKCFAFWQQEKPSTENQSRKEDNAMYEIEKNIPVSPKIYGGGPKSIYPFLKMDIGDSFLVPCEISEKTRIRNRVNSSLRHYVRDGRKFSIRNVQEGIRVWRIS